MGARSKGKERAHRDVSQAPVLVTVATTQEVGVNPFYMCDNEPQYWPKPRCSEAVVNPRMACCQVCELPATDPASCICGFQTAFGFLTVTSLLLAAFSLPRAPRSSRCLFLHHSTFPTTPWPLTQKKTPSVPKLLKISYHPHCPTPPFCMLSLGLSF